MLGLVERITLTPEGISFDEQRRLTRALPRRGHRVFCFTYHSSSLAPGNTPYVRSEADLQVLLRRIDQYLDFFTREIGGRERPRSKSRRSRNGTKRRSTAAPKRLLTCCPATSG